MLCRFSVDLLKGRIHLEEIRACSLCSSWRDLDSKQGVPWVPGAVQVRTEVALLPPTVRPFQHPYGGTGKTATQADGHMAHLYLVMVLNKTFKLYIVLIAVGLEKRQEKLGYKY